MEDIGSRHGVWVRQDRVEARAVLPGEPFRIGPFSLSVTEETDRPIAADPSASASTTITEDDSPTEILPAAASARAARSALDSVFNGPPFPADLPDRSTHRRWCTSREP